MGGDEKTLNFVDKKKREPNGRTRGPPNYVCGLSRIIKTETITIAFHRRAEGGRVASISNLGKKQPQKDRVAIRIASGGAGCLDGRRIAVSEARYWRCGKDDRLERYKQNHVQLVEYLRNRGNAKNIGSKCERSFKSVLLGEKGDVDMVGQNKGIGTKDSS
ncbi:hypothetical protein PIB30_020820 [Stylosanthes scabra]|uniref:Uncharacterized protein n=1 Tax=Stylosanthes scabra TaxID=79078 RepID=A0ABU6T8I0_9FABA|nr:hypothetical protein [Stylosanthes scabra]